MDRDALSKFLIRRRGDLQPEDVGIFPGPRRRTVGLRREEVAQLAQMSTDYYTRLEQGRSTQPSAQILSSLARALRLSLDERDYLYRIAGLDAPDRAGGGGYVAPALLRVLDRLTDTPALIVTMLGEILAQNAPAAALYGDTGHLKGWERSEIFRWFAHPETARLIYPEGDRERQSLAQVSGLRAALGIMGQRSRAGELVRELERISPEFVTLWAQQRVQRRFSDHKTLVHPELGEIEVDCQTLFTEDQSQALLVLSAAPRSEAESKLQMLRVLGAQRFVASNEALSVAD